jgi:hypothetical protein
MAAISPYRALTPDERAELIVRVIKANKATRALFVMRVLEKLRGFRAVTLQKWPADQLAREVVRLKAETPQDEFDLLLALYVELEPEIQIAFLDAAGVKHEKGAIDDELDPPYGDAACVPRTARAASATCRRCCSTTANCGPASRRSSRRPRSRCHPERSGRSRRHPERSGRRPRSRRISQLDHRDPSTHRSAVRSG